jgi:hypothetical protein
MRASFLLLAIAISVPVIAEAADKKKAPGDKVVCRSTEVTGSRVLGNRVCKTKREWEADKHRTETQMLEMNQDGVRQDPIGDRAPPIG